MHASGIESPLEHRTIQTNGVSLHVVLAGPESGKALVLLHGFPEFWYGWRKQIDHFANLGFRVIVPDQRGYNLSDKPKGVGAYSIDKLGADVVGILDALGHRQAFLVGHDWGAAVAWYVAARYPERIMKVGILNVPHTRVMKRNLMTNPAQRRKSWYVFLFQLPWLPELKIRRRGFEMAVRSLRDTSRPGTFSEAELELYKKSWATPGAFTAMINWYRAALQRRVKEASGRESSRVRVPALIIWGAKDRFLGREMAAQSLEYCDQGRLELIDDATHWVQHEEPAKVNELLTTFFA